MLRIHTSERIELLAARLAEVLADAPADPLTPEWIAVPSEGMRRWLHLQLAAQLGAGPLGGDGIAANITSAFPASLRIAVLEAGSDPAADAWQVDQLVWSVLAELATTELAELVDITDLPVGASLYARARRIADLFDRYHVHRVDMVLHWLAGDDLDSTGRILPGHQRWQPVLWRRVRERIGLPSPPELQVAVMDSLLSGSLPLDLPQRLTMFGLSVLPGGVGFLDLAEAVGAERDLHLYFVEPSPVAALEVAATLAPPGDVARSRSEDESANSVRNPLLRSWGRLYRETTVLLSDAQRQGLAPIDRISPAHRPDGQTLLGRLQLDLCLDRVVAADFRPDLGDRSIQLHAAHGAARQVEVLRDVVLHLLDEHPDLSEDDILVMSPALDQLAPVIEAVLGPSVERSAPASAVGLRYQIADRSVQRGVPLFDAVERVLTAATGRFDAAEVLDLIALEPIRQRFRFTDDDVARIGEWTAAAKVRWGIDEQHREQHGLPASFDTNTWRAALDRLLLGSALGDASAVGVGSIVPLPIDGSDVAVAGRLTELLWRLEQLSAASKEPRPISEWTALLRHVAERLFAVDRTETWQTDGFTAALAVLDDNVQADPVAADLPVSFADVRRAVVEQFAAVPSRAGFFRGGVTISSMTPLRGVPYRVIILLGVDQPAFSVGAPDGDDLAAAAPLLGDRDRRGESRQGLLEAVLAARERLILIREGNDVRTNQVVPRAVPVAELVDAVLSGVAPDIRDDVARHLEVRHPRQAFDEAAFIEGAIVAGRPWSFDRSAHQGAVARRDRSGDDQPFLPGPLARTDEPVIGLADLQAFFEHPIAHFVRRELGVRFPSASESPSVMVPLDLKGLEGYDVGHRLLEWRLAGGDQDDWAGIERRLGTLGPGHLADTSVRETGAVVDALFAAAVELGIRSTDLRSIPIDVTLPDGTRIVGSVVDRLDGRPGPARITYAAARPAYDLAAWLNLVAVVAQDPSTPWRSVVVARRPRKAEAEVTQIEVTGTDGVDSRHSAAIRGLAVAVDCYRRGLVEPLPLFPLVSYDLWAGDSPFKNWIRHQGGGDGANDFTRLVHGEADLRQLLDIARLPDDPVTESGPKAGRLQCFAEYVWGTVDSTSASITAPPADGSDAPNTDDPDTGDSADTEAPR